MTWPGQGGTLSCDAAHEQITLLLYGELSDEACHRLEQHLAGCADCRDELEVTRALSSAMAILPVREPSPNLIAQTRLRIDEALEQAPSDSWFTDFRRSLWTDFRLMRTAPLAAATMLFAGAGLGFAGFKLAHPPAAAPAWVDPGTQPIAAVTGVAQDPATGMVRVEYSRLVPSAAVGPADDPIIRKLLLAGTRAPLNTSVQNAALGLLAHTCSVTGSGTTGDCAADDSLRSALMVALRYDPHPNVRELALSGLAPYLGEDMHVRDAVLEAVLNDGDPQIRAQAIRMLAPVAADSSVQQVLQNVATHDGNPLLRTVSRTMLEQMPQVQ
ncbi:MAG TPA: zf-HC2 domain-containing protein [Acidobacteriaceae bacterium]